MNSDLELKLLAGYNISTEMGLIHQPRIKDVIDIGESTYNQYIGLLLYDTDLLKIPKSDLEKMKLDKIDTFDFIYFQGLSNNEFRKLIEDALKFFFREDILLLDNYGLFLVGDINNQKFITKDSYETVKHLLIKMNYLKDMEEEENLEFANDLAREWYLNIKKAEKNQPKPKPQVNLHSIVSAMAWRTNKSMDEILNMTIYQLYDGYYRLFLIDDCISIKQGIYQGTVDKDKIKSTDLNWAKIIKFEEN